MSRLKDFNLDRWLFVVSLSVLGSMLAWQLVQVNDPIRPQSSNPVPAYSTVKPDYTRVESGRYSEQELDYFYQIAFQSEHIELPPLIRKWTQDIVIRVEGDFTSDDLKAVKTAVDLLNELQDQVTLSIGLFEANVIVHFRPESDFSAISARYQPYNRGFFWVRWIDEEIYHATVLIDSDSTEQEERNVLVLEELTQSLGLMNASAAYEGSIFNDEQEFTTMTLSPMDRALVSMLYQQTILPGMTPEDALQRLAEITPEETD